MQESGVPNVTGRIGYQWYGIFDLFEGCFYNANNSQITWKSSPDHRANNANFSLNRSSNQYQSIKEVRVKSIISNGYIKLY